MRRSLLPAVLAGLVSAPAAAATFEVAPGGSDGADGTTAPWVTLQKAADTVGPGDTVVVRAGTYAGFHLETSGAEGAPITFRADDGVVIDRDNGTTADGINLEGASHVVVQGFTVEGMDRAGIRAVLCERVTIVGNVARDNQYWGILTGFCDDLLIEGNETSGSVVEHGIYVSNSGDRPVLRGNRIHHNNANGIHMNGDVSLGGDGIISGALVEQNVVWENGVGGGSGINCDGVQSSTIRNNLVYDTHASGISLYVIDGGGASLDNVVVHNTVLVAADGRWALNIQNGSTGNVVRNNILYSGHDVRGSISIDAASAAALTSDHNIVEDRFDLADTFITLAQWRAQTSQDTASVVAAPAALFVDEANDDHHLASASPAIDLGTDVAVTVDLEGDPRPQGAAPDVGADERCAGACVTDGGPAPADAGAASVDGGAPGDDAGSVPADAGLPGTDGGFVPDDGGARGTDAGLVSDAGGASNDDDAGPATDDAGVPDEGDDPPAGCGCRASNADGAAAPAAAAAVVAVPAFFARRRPRARRPRA